MSEFREQLEALDRVIAVRHDLIEAFRISTQRHGVTRDEAHEAVASFWQTAQRAFEQIQEAS